MNGRRIGLDVLYDNQTITVDIEPFITDVSFTDNFSGQADTISVSLGDRERKWMGSWMPKKSASLEASLVIPKDWGLDKSYKRFLGYFEIDDINISGPPNKVTINGTSVPEASDLKSQRSRSWEKTNFRNVVSDIAKKNGMKLYFGCEDNPVYDRLDQDSETDLAFLMRICNDHGYALKVANNSISIFDEVAFEKEDAVDTISRTDFRLMDFNGNDTLSGVYKSCKVSYTDSKSKKTYTYTYTPPKPPKTNKVLVVNESAKSKSDAIRLAKKNLRNENKKATTMTLKMAGFALYYAGHTLNLKNFGGFDGKYIVTSVSGKVGNSSETSLELRKCLEGY